MGLFVFSFKNKYEFFAVIVTVAAHVAGSGAGLPHAVKTRLCLCLISSTLDFLVLNFYCYKLNL